MKNRIIFLLIVIAGLCAVLLISCNENQIGAIERDEMNEVSIENSLEKTFQKTNNADPQEVSDNFFAMVETVQNMEREEIERLTEDDIMELGQPIVLNFDNTILLDNKTLKELDNVLKDINTRITSMTRKDHSMLSNEVNKIIKPHSNFEPQRRHFDSNKLKEILLTIQNEDLQIIEDEFYNTTSSCVVLTPGDNFNTANSFFPSNTTFCVDSGTHVTQVSNPKNGNKWIGFTDAVMHGMYSSSIPGFNGLNYAFSGSMNGNSYHFLKISNYRSYGIESDNGSNVLVQNIVFINIANNRNGQEYGAVRFQNSSAINVNSSHFENVASAIRFIDNSNGNLFVTYNTALNPGRNFFQCNNCNGGNIRINNNSMEHNQQVASQKLEDFINIFKSNGASSDWIKVNNNRARTDGTGNGVSSSGCAILLGDYGGSFQESQNNIGVNPGNCGIGVASGNFIKVQNNKMYSKFIDGISNVGFYSWKNPSEAPSCSHHTFEGNIANYIYAQDPNQSNYGDQNHAWTDGSCGNTQITDSSSVSINLNMGPEIWGMW